ncbi:MAG: hypothetical protein AAF357_10130 [Verrucomicrobiota bacterium]
MNSCRTNSDGEPVSPKSWLFGLGVFLILLSGLCFFTMLSVPFLPVDDEGKKAMLGGGLFVGMQATWWTGAAFVGPTAVRKMSDWFKRAKKT